MPQSAKSAVQLDKIPEVELHQEEDEVAKTPTDFGRILNNESDFSSMFYEENEFNSRNAFSESAHAGYKRDVAHR